MNRTRKRTHRDYSGIVILIGSLTLAILCLYNTYVWNV